MLSLPRRQLRRVLRRALGQVFPRPRCRKCRRCARNLHSCAPNLRRSNRSSRSVRGAHALPRATSGVPAGTGDPRRSSTLVSLAAGPKTARAVRALPSDGNGITRAARRSSVQARACAAASRHCQTKRHLQRSAPNAVSSLPRHSRCKLLRPSVHGVPPACRGRQGAYNLLGEVDERGRRCDAVCGRPIQSLAGPHCC